MTNTIESLIKNDFEFISNYSEYQKLNIDINNKIIKLRDKLININNSKNILLNSLLQNKDKSKKMLKFYFSYIYYEKKKLNKILNKCIKQKQKYKKHNLNKYNKFINSIEKIILLNPIINEICNITCPICLNTKITCMVKLVSNNSHSIGKNNNIINMSNCKGTIICYDCSVNMYNNNLSGLYSCILCNKKIKFNKNEPPFDISDSHTKIIDTILKNEYYIFEEKMNLILPYIIIYDNIKFKYLKDLNLYLINKINKINEYNNDTDTDSYSDSDSDNESLRILNNSDSE